MSKEYLTLVLDLLVLLGKDEDDAVTGIFSDETIDKMNELKAKILNDLADGGESH